MDYIIGIIAFVFVLGVIVIVHEGGHFLFARRVNILCREFAFGMGPLLWSKKKGETQYSLRAFPIGGFCAIAGEELEADPFNGLDEVRLEIVDGKIVGFYLNDCNTNFPKKKIVKYDIFDALETGNLFMTVLEDGEEVTYPVHSQAMLYDQKLEMQIAPYNRTLNSKKKRDRALVIFGGPLMNFLLALIVFFIAGLIQGYPNYSSAKLDDITSGTPVWEAGLRDGDIITKLSSGELVLDITKWDDISTFMDSYTNNKNNLPIKITYSRNNSEKKAIINPYLNVYNAGFGNDYTLIGLLSVYGKLPDNAKITKLQAGLLSKDVLVTTENKTAYYAWNKENGLVAATNDDLEIVNFNKIVEFFNEYLESDATEKIIISYKINNEVRTASLDASDIFYTENGKYTSFKVLVSSYSEYDNNMANNTELKIGDIILGINGNKVTSQNDISDAFNSYVGSNDEEITLNVLRNGEELSINVKPFSKKVMATQTTTSGDQIPNVKIAMGVSPSYKFSLVKSFAYSGKRTLSSMTAIFDTFGLLFSGSASVSNLSGPVGIFSLTKSVATQGFAQLLNLMGLLSVNIGLLNLLPIPALDGGRLVFIAYEAITKKKPNQKVETVLITVTMLLLFALMIYVTFGDILRLLGLKG